MQKWGQREGISQPEPKPSCGPASHTGIRWRSIASISGQAGRQRQRETQEGTTIEAHDRNWTYLGIGSLVYQFPCKLKHTERFSVSSSSLLLYGAGAPFHSTGQGHRDRGYVMLYASMRG